MKRINIYLLRVYSCLFWKNVILVDVFTNIFFLYLAYSCVGGYEGQRCDQKSSTYQQNITSCSLPHYKDEHFCKE